MHPRKKGRRLLALCLAAGCSDPNATSVDRLDVSITEAATDGALVDATTRSDAIVQRDYQQWLSCSEPLASARALRVDEATRCPTRVEVRHTFTSPGTCDQIESCCDFPRACVFSLDVTTYVPGPCGSMGFTQNTAEYRRSNCQCVDGRIECAGERILDTACLDCPQVFYRDGG